MKIEKEMSNKYSYDNWDKLKCNENEQILLLEKKFDNFSIDKGYNYASNMVLNNNLLPEINLDLSKIMQFYKNSENNSTDDLIKEINSFNFFFNSLSQNISLNKVQTLKEKNIVYYLFYFMGRAFFYTIMNNNFLFREENKKDFTIFFENFKNILNTSKLYLEAEIKDVEKIDLILYESFKSLKKYEIEFRESILSCHNFIILISLFDVGEKNTHLELLENLVIILDYFYKINKKYEIIDYKYFYNYGLSKKTDFKSEFRKYMTNEKIRKIKKLLEEIK